MPPSLRSCDLHPKQVRRFWEHVERRGPDECWPWTGHFNPLGYGTRSFTLKPRRRTFWAHRLAYELHHGVVLDRRVEVHHVCNRRACCNPAHMEALSRAEHNQRTHLSARRLRLTEEEADLLLAAVEGKPGYEALEERIKALRFRYVPEVGSREKRMRTNSVTPG